MVIRLAANTNRILESEYGCGKSIGFSTFTSCIGVVAGIPEGKIVGIHLVLVSATGTQMTPNDVSMVGTVLTRCGFTANQPFEIVGSISTWRKSAEETFVQLNKLGSNLGIEPKWVQREGTIKATRDGNSIKYTFA